MVSRIIQRRSGILWFLNLLIGGTWCYDPTSRWGQATVVVNDALFVFGGKVDEFNSFSYTSAPNTNDILYLSLASPFPAVRPPWELVSSSSNSSTSQGPALAWASLSALNRDEILLVGGQTDPNSPIGSTDTAIILDVFNRLGPYWRLEDSSALINQPRRRIRHSTATLPSGLVFVFGGERVDGSRMCLSDSWVLDPESSSFTELPSDNGPPALCGHASIPLADGRILVLGGYSSSSGRLLQLSTIYVLDTTQTPYTWSQLEVSSDSVPGPRRAFATALIAPDKILIHGGADASFQNALGDGWILDLSQSPATWNRVDELSDLGSRFDHFAVAHGEQVVIGFGYESSGPAPPALQVFDTGSQRWVPSYAPPTSQPTPTLPPATRPSESSTTTTKKGKPTSGGGANPSPHPTDSDSDNPDGQQPEAGKKKSIVIAVSTTVGVIALILVVATGYYYRRHRHRRFWDERRFIPLPGGFGDDDSQVHRDIPRAGGMVEGKEGRLHGLAGLFLGVGSLKSRNPRELPERRNMLDDEDAHDFGAWYETRRRDGSQGSSWSLMSFLGGGKRSRDASITGHSTTSSTPWREKTDPFSDGTPIANDEETGYAAVRPRARREASHISTRSALSYASYTDPFTDPIKEDQHEASDTSYQGDNPVRLVTPRAPPLALRTNFPLEHVGHPLSPLSERTSRSTLPAPESGASSSDNVSRFSATGSLATSNTSHVEPPRSPTLLSNLLPSTTERPVHRSDSWWSRLGRRKSDASGRSVAYPSLRDPNPPPRLVTIDESVHSRSPDKDSPQSKRSSPSIPTPSGSSQQQQQREEHSQPYAGRHGKSMSSLRTADSEAIERIGGTMEVVQRVKSFRSRRGRGSTESTAESSIHTDLSVEREHEEFATYASPTEMDPHESIIAFAPTTTVTPPVALYTNPASGSSAASRPLPVSPSGDVAAKIQAYERQQSQGADEGKHRKGKRHMVDYGLVPRRSLFVANPDNRVSQSSIESS